MLISRGTIKRCPYRLSNEQSHGMYSIRFVHRKPMINALRQSHQISRLNMNSHPLILFVPNVEISRSTDNVTNFFRVMNVLLEETFNLRVIFGQGVGVDCDDIRIGVAAIVTDFG